MEWIQPFESRGEVGMGDSIGAKVLPSGVRLRCLRPETKCADPLVFVCGGSRGIDSSEAGRSLSFFFVIWTLASMGFVVGFAVSQEVVRGVMMDCLVAGGRGVAELLEEVAMVGIGECLEVRAGTKARFFFPISLLEIPEGAPTRLFGSAGVTAVAVRLPGGPEGVAVVVAVSLCFLLALPPRAKRSSALP